MHTPGPWKAICNYPDYIAITDEMQMYGPCKIEKSANENWQMMEANAHLIVEAPAMLECLENVLKFLGKLPGNTGGGTQLQLHFEMIEHQILKARGGK